MDPRLFIAFIAVIALAGCGESKAPEPRPTPVGAEQVRMHDGTLPMRYSANIQPRDQVDVSFRVSGYVEHVLQVRGADGRMRAIQDGDHVTRGTVLARLRNTDYRARAEGAKASLAEAEASLAKAQLDFERAARLYQAESLIKPDYDSARANLDMSRARVDAARERLEEAHITYRDSVLVAPLTGLVLRRNITAGTLASPGAPAFSIADTSSVKAVFGVPDIAIAGLKAGQALEVSADALPGEPLRGQITRIAAAADSSSRVFDVEVTLPNKDERLKSGMVASLKVVEQASAAVPVVPLSAVVGSKPAGAYAVFVVEDAGGKQTARQRTIEIGEAFGNRIAIQSGLKAGERIVTVGADLLRDGERIQIVSSTAKAEN